MTLVVKFRNTNGARDAIVLLVQCFYSRIYDLGPSDFEHKQVTDGILEWPQLPYNAMLDKVIHMSGFYLKYKAAYVVCDNGVLLEKTLSTWEDRYMTKANDLVRASGGYTHPITSMTYWYSLLMMNLYRYYIATGIKVNEIHTHIVFGTVASQCFSENTYTKVYHVTKGWFYDTPLYTRSFRQVGSTLPLMVAESILMSYDTTGCMFKYHKGLFMAKMVSEALDPTSQQAASLIAHVLRMTFATSVRGNTASASYNVHMFTNGWKRVQGDKPLTDAIAAFKNFYVEYVNSKVVSVIKVPLCVHNANMNSMYRYTSYKTFCDTVKACLVVESFDLMRIHYDKTLMFEDRTFDLRSFRIRNHYPHDVASCSIPYKFYNWIDGYNPSVESMLDKIMQDFFASPIDREYIYNIFGRCLMGNVDDKSFWIFIGRSNAGKSKFMQLIKKAFGNYAEIMPGEFFNRKTKVSSDATPEITKSLGKLVGIIQEPRKGAVDVETIKERTGDSEINFRMLYSEASTMHNTTRYFACANHIRFESSDHAFWARCKVVLFSRCFVSSIDYDSYSARKTAREMETYRVMDADIDKKFDIVAPCLMSRFIRAYRNTQGRPLDTPSTIQRYTQELRKMCDTISRFLENIFMPTAPGEPRMSASHVYAMFIQWYKLNFADRKNHIDQSMFVQALISNGVQVDDSNGVHLKCVNKGTMKVGRGGDSLSMEYRKPIRYSPT